MHPHKKKMIAPIIIAVIITLYYLIFFGFFLAALDGIWRYIVGIVPLIPVAVIIYVCVERLREIKKGEEDDLSQY